MFLKKGKNNIRIFAHYKCSRETPPEKTIKRASNCEGFSRPRFSRHAAHI